MGVQISTLSRFYKELNFEVHHQFREQYIILTRGEYKYMHCQSSELFILCNAHLYHTPQDLLL